MANLNLLRVCTSVTLITLAVLNPVWADDTEIFFGNATAASHKPNVLFILDASGSMMRFDCQDGEEKTSSCGDGTPNGESSRLDRMADALLQILDATQGINVGLMRFSHDDAGGRILFPIMDIDQEVCGYGPCMAVRDHLKQHVSQMVASGVTPTVGAMLEAYNYFTGKGVQYGKSRLFGRVEDGAPKNNRVSHPLSYTGGTHVVPAGCDVINNPNDTSCEDERIAGNPVYVSPIQHECQANHIILLTDGEPSGTPPVADTQGIIGGACGPSSASAGTCGAELSAHLADTDVTSTFVGDQNIITHTVGFNFTSPWLATLATAKTPEGDASSHTASSSADLVETINAIFAGAEEVDATFVAPSVTVDQFTRLSHRKEMYLALFKPQSSSKWKGNLKKYKLTGSIATLKDADGNVAVDPDKGSFVESSRSYWSAAADGSDVILGGAASNLDPSDRKIVSYVDTGNYDLLATSNRIEIGNTLVGSAMLGAATEAERDTYIDWLTGHDVLDEDEDGDIREARNHIGDPLHSSPVVVSYGAEAGSTVDPDNLNSLVFFGTNEGFLHAIDSSDGTEEYAFMPRELMPNVAVLYEDLPLSSFRPKTYGLDGQITLRTIDNNSNGLIEADDGDKAYLYFGMRRGGNNYYALDVSVKDQPKFMWTIWGDENDYEELGQSWSKPIVSRLKIDDEIKDVLVFSGGYDAQQDDHEFRTADSEGRAIFIADADTGELIWSGGNPATQPYGSNEHQAFPEMLYSIPSDLAVVNDPQSGLMSQIYVGDMGGRLWRFDFDNGSPVRDLVDGGIIADFGADGSVAGARRFYAAPDLSLTRVDGELMVNIAIGSGYRAHPLDTDIDDKFFVYRYPYSGNGDSNYGVSDVALTYTPATINDLFDTTLNLIGEGTDAEKNDATTELATKEGWYITMEENGEKILDRASTIDGIVRFISYVPSGYTGHCEPSLGSSFYWTVNLDDGTPYYDEETDTGDRSRGTRKSEIPGGGIAPPISTIFVEYENGVKPTDVSGFNTLHEWDNVDLLRRWFWAENPEG